MFVIERSYKAELSQIDAAMTAHVQRLREHLRGTLVPSGRKQLSQIDAAMTAHQRLREHYAARSSCLAPRCRATAQSSSPSVTTAPIEAIILRDPFVSRGLADYRLVEFNASQRADDIPVRVE